MLRILGRVCYGLMLGSIGISLARVLIPANKPAPQRWFYRDGVREEAEQMAIFFGLWAPTFGIVGKILEDFGREREYSDSGANDDTVVVIETIEQSVMPEELVGGLAE